MHRHPLGWILLATLSFSGPARAAERLTFNLNYLAGGDHAPLYFARKEGWFEAAGLNVDILQTQGSAAALQQVAAGKSQAGIVDMANVLIGRGKGIKSIAVMNIYANSPYGIYWLKSSGIFTGEVAARLSKASTLAAAAEDLNAKGLTRNSFETLLDVEPLIFEVTALLNAASIVNRFHPEDRRDLS